MRCGAAYHPKRPAAMGVKHMESVREPGEKVVREIQYFTSFSALKRLLEHGKITLEDSRQANVALAEKYGVSWLPI